MKKKTLSSKRSKKSFYFLLVVGIMIAITGGILFFLCKEQIATLNKLINADPTNVEYINSFRQFKKLSDIGLYTVASGLILSLLSIIPLIISKSAKKKEKEISDYQFKKSLLSKEVEKENNLHTLHMIEKESESEIKEAAEEIAIEHHKKHKHKNNKKNDTKIKDDRKIKAFYKFRTILNLILFIIFLLASAFFYINSNVKEIVSLGIDLSWIIVFTLPLSIYFIYRIIVVRIKRRKALKENNNKKARLMEDERKKKELEEALNNSL